MSKYSENQTQFKDCNLLIEALVDMGFTRDEIEVHEKPQNLYDYHKNKTRYLDGTNYDTAEVIIRQQFINNRFSGGASNDLGFKKNANGTYSAIISEYDSRFINSAWMGKLKTNYAERGVVQQAQKVGLRYIETKKKDGKRQLVFLQN